MNVLGAPAAEVVADMQKNLQEPDDAGLMDLYTRIIDRAGEDRQGHALQQREVHVDVQPLGLESPAKRSMISRNLVRTAFKCSRLFLRAKSRRLFEQSSLRSKVENFSYCFKNAFFQ